MLINLSVRDFLLIEKLDLDFEKGLCVISGETGAGKSIILDSLLFCLGLKSDPKFIRNGADQVSASAIFYLNDQLKKILSEFEIFYEDTIIIKRVFTSKKINKYMVNNEPVTKKNLQQITEVLIEFHGQNVQNSLNNISSHRDILDRFGKLETIKIELQQVYNDLMKLKQELKIMDSEQVSLIREKDYLNFVIEELQKLNVEEGEESKLSETRINLQRQEKTQQAIDAARNIANHSKITNDILQIQKLLNHPALHESCKEIVNLLDQSLINFEEAIDQISSKAMDIEESEMQLDEVETRLFSIRQCARKYNMLPDELNNYLDECQTKINKLDFSIANRDKIKQKITQQQKLYDEISQKLTSNRREAAIILENKIAEELKLLHMDKAIFTVEISPAEKISSHGADEVRFLASTNPGTPKEPIDKIASGGELSRIMLAANIALLEANIKPTIIFDEIDTGIGGAVADAVGKRLKVLAQAVQVLVITHQPQVASKSMQHILVNKTQNENSTSIKVAILDNEAKIKEIARMLSGESVTESAENAAKDLVEA